LKNTLTALFNIRPGEEKTAALLLLHSFFIGITVIFTETAAYTLFITKFRIENLPLAYIASACVIVMIGYIYSKTERYVSCSTLFVLTLSFLFVCIICAYISALMIKSGAVAIGMIICFNIISVLGELEFWGLAGRLLTVRQGKRLYGLIGSGESAAGIIGGFSVPFLLEKIGGTEHLLAVSAIGMLFCIAILFFITREFEKQLSAPDEEKKEEKEKSALLEFFKDPYLRLVIALASCSMFGYYFSDYVFYNQVDTMPAEKVAGFLGIFFAALRIGSLISNIFISGRLITRYGLKIGLLFFPLMIAAGLVSTAFSHFVSGPGMIFFGLIVSTKFIDEVCRHTLERPSIRILYQPLPQGIQLRAQTVLETMVEPVSAAAAGAVLLMLTSSLPEQFRFKAVHIVYLMFFILAIWMLAAFRVRRKYADVFADAIRRRRLDGSAISLNDKSTLRVLKKGLESPEPGKVIYCLNMLEDIEDESLETSMIRLLDHAEPSVRIHVFRRIGTLGMSNALHNVIRRLDKEKGHPEVMGAALQTLCAISETEAFRRVVPYLSSENTELRKGAMIGLLKNTGLEGFMEVGADLKSLLSSHDPSDRKLAALVLGEVGISSFYSPLIKLLSDEDMDVRRAAIMASASLKNPKLLPFLLNNISVPQVRQAAVSAIIMFGDGILGELEKAFDKEGQTRSVRTRIIRIVGRVGGEKAIAFLKNKTEAADEDTRNHILYALVLCRYQASSKEFQMIQIRIRKEAADAAWTLSAMLDIGDYEHADDLIKALKSELLKIRSRIFLLLAMIYPSDEIMSARTKLASSSKATRDTAVEVLANTVRSQYIKDIVFPLMEDFTVAEQYSRLIPEFPQKLSNPHERIKEVVGRSQQLTSSWTRACALFTIGKIGTREFYDTVVSALADPDPTVRETAVWALGALNPDDLADKLMLVVRKDKDKNPRVAEFARFIINSVAFATVPMGKGYLTRSGRYTLELFKNILMDEKERRARRCRAANILSRFNQSPDARTALLEGLKVADKTVRTSVLDALIKGKFSIKGSAQDMLLGLLWEEIEDTLSITRCIMDFLLEKHSGRLTDSLNQEIAAHRKRALSVLTLMNDDRTSFDTIFYWYIYQKDKAIPKEIRAKLEKSVSVLQEDKRSRVFAFFQPLNLERLRLMAKPQPRGKIISHLKKIAFGLREKADSSESRNFARAEVSPDMKQSPDDSKKTKVSSLFSLSWSRICALEMIAKLDCYDCVSAVTELLNSSEDDIVRATAVWVLYQLDRGAYEKHGRKLKNDRSELVSRTVAQLEDEIKAGAKQTLKAGRAEQGIRKEKAIYAADN